MVSITGACMRTLWVMTLMACFCVSGLFAQSQLGTGAISGTIQDATGAVIPAAEITITQADTGLTRKVTTTEAGQFVAPVLPAGLYHVRAAKEGFQTAEQDDVVVNVGAAANLNFTLSIGDITQTVTVTAVQTIDPAQTDVSSLVDRNQIADLP